MKRTIIIVSVIVIAVVGIFIYVRYRSTKAANQALNELQISQVEKGSLMATIGATGSVRANQSAVLNWQTNGRVASIFASCQANT